MEEVVEVPEVPKEGAQSVGPAPKIIHFAWAGGTSPMPDKSMNVVMRWLIKNPDFTIYLWVDEKTCGDPESFYALYRENFKRIYDELKESGEIAEDIKKITFPLVFLEKDTDELLPGKIIIKDIFTNKLRNIWISYFIELLKPNYGASSDLLRDLALELGGAYFDSDVAPGPTCLGTLPIFNESGIHRVMLDDFSQKGVLTSQQRSAPFTLENSELKQRVGNDVIGSTKGNPLLSCFYDFSINRLIELGKSKEGRFALCYGSRDIKYLTVYATGPQSVRDCIDFYPQVPHNRNPRGGFDVVIDPNGKSRIWSAVGPKVEISPIRYGNTDPIKPLIPTHNWLKVDNTRYHRLNQLKSALVNVILFEVAHFHILRIDDHIEDLIELSKGFHESERFTQETAFKFICEVVPILKKPQLRNELLLKVTGKFEVSLRALRDALPKTSEDLKQMISCMAYWGEFCGLFVQEHQLEDESGYVKELGEYYKEEGKLPQSLTAILRSINASMDAFEVYCRPAIPFLEYGLEVEAKQLVTGYLKKYLNFVNGVLKAIPANGFQRMVGQKLDELMYKIVSMMGNLKPKEERAIELRQPSRKFF